MENSIISKAKSKITSLLICPHCKQKPIIINDITPQGKIYYQCDCSNVRYEDTITSFISKLCSLQTIETICFRHKDQIAQLFCKDCDYYMCKLCESFHSSFQPWHKVTVLTNGFSSNCIQHKGSPKELICLTCNCDICKECQMDTHSKHEIIQMKDLYENISETLPFKSIDEYTKQYTEEFNEIDAVYQKQLDTLQMIQEHLDSIKQEIKDEYDHIIDNNTNGIIFMGSLLSNFFRNKEFSTSISLMNIIKVSPDSSAITNRKNNKMIFNQQASQSFNQTPTGFPNHGPLTGIVRPKMVANVNVYNKNSLNKIEEISKNLMLFKDESLSYFKEHKIVLKSNKLSFPLRNRTLFARSYHIKFKTRANPIQTVIDIYTHLKNISQMIELPNKRIAINNEDHTIIVIGQKCNNQFEIINKNMCHQHGAITAFCLLQNGNLISGTSNTSYGNKNTIDPIREWNLTTFECVKIISSIHNKINAMTQVSKELLAVSLVLLEIQIVDLATGQITKTLSSPLTNGKILSMLTNGDLVSVSHYDKRRQAISVWNIESGKIVKAVERNSISVLKEMPNNRLLFNEGNKIVIYNMTNNAEERNIMIEYPSNEVYQQIQFGQGAPPILHGYGNRTNEPFANEICSLCFLDSNRLLVAFSTNYIKIVDIELEQKETIILLLKAKLGLITHFNTDNVIFLKNNTISLAPI